MRELKRKINNQIVPLVLASESEGRKLILESLNFKFSIDCSDIVEESYSASNAEELVTLLAMEKAQTAAKKYTDALVIGADTVICYQGEIIGKPASKVEAEKILLKLSGNTHQVITGLAIIDVAQNKTVQVIAISYVTFFSITLAEIQEYVATGEPMGKSGAYASQGLAAKFIKNISGDITNVIGLPKDALLTLFDELGFCF